MPSWNELLDEFNALPTDIEKQNWVSGRLHRALASISALRDNRNVILYGSAFLQKPTAPQHELQLNFEDINGFMSVMYGMDWTKNLTLILHTPGGITNAAETLVAYLRQKFTKCEVIIPTYAMSAGTMIALAAERIVMGRQSQLGPIDPQLPIGGRYVSARAVTEQFERAKGEVTNDVRTAHVWAPILASMGPALLQEAQNALDYGELMVKRWLETGMCSGNPIAAARIAHHFNDATTHKSHGRRIDRKEAEGIGVVIEELESTQMLQEHVLTAYHLMGIIITQGPAVKLIQSGHGRAWVKNAIA